MQKKRYCLHVKLHSKDRKLVASPAGLSYDTYYHIYNRGINRFDIFLEERNYAYFLQLAFGHLIPVMEIFAYCMMRNHFHMLVRVKSETEILGHHKTEKTANPSQSLSNFFNAYAKAINKAYNRTGSLFTTPFGRVPIRSDRQMWNVIAYIHQNPQKHRFVNDFRDWKHSSYEILLSDLPTNLNRVEVMNWFGGRNQYIDLHQEWVELAKSKWFIDRDED